MKLQFQSAILLASSILMTACATTANFETSLNTWVGKSESELVGSLGTPVQIIKLPDGDHSLVYISNRVIRSGGYSTQSNSYNYDDNKKKTNGGNGSSTSTQQYVPLTDSLYSCVTRYIIHNDLVKATGHTGNDCKSANPKYDILHSIVQQRAA